ncbi:MAG: hypothetical protein J0H64_05365, partial [Actinobacteria bacterium]|nr:hypothetical protein [Actinomycetota bacterium]
LATVLVALALPLSPSAGSAIAAPARAPQPAQPAAKSTASEPLKPALVLAAQQPVLDPNAENYVFTVLIRNPGDSAIAAGTLQLRLDVARIVTVAQLRTTQTQTAQDPAFGGLLLTEVDVPQTAPDTEQNLTVTVPRADLPLGSGSEAGVYAVHAELHAQTDTGADQADPGTDPTTQEGATLLSGTGTVVWRGAHGSGNLPLTLVVPLVLPGSVDGMPTRNELSEAMPRFERLLEAAERWRATVAIDPRIIAGIRAYGDSAPAPAREFLTRLGSGTTPQFLLQFADADPAAEAALGASELMRPTGLSYVTSQGSFPAPIDAESAPGTSGTQPVQPTLDELLAWPTATPGAWPAPGQVNQKTLDLLTKADAGSLVLESGNVAGADGAPGRSGRIQLDGLDTLVSDAGLDAAARSMLLAQTETDRAAGSAELTALLALSAESDKPGGAVLALDRGAVADAENPADIFDSLDALSWVRPTAAAAQAMGQGTLQPGKTDKQRVALLRSARERSAQIDALAPLLERPWYLGEYQRVRLLQDFATRYADPDTDLTTLDAELLQRDDALLSGVRVVPSENTQLIGSSSRLPVLVHNALPFDAVITLKVAPTSASVAVPERRFEGRAVAAGANSTVLVPVDSRVSSGEATLTVRVADSVDELTFSEERLRLTLRSSYEAIMLGVLGVLAALLFGFGIWRSLRRHRMIGRDEPPAEPSGTE